MINVVCFVLGCLIGATFWTIIFIKKFNTNNLDDNDYINDDDDCMNDDFRDF